MPKAAFTTLGCKVNQYETQKILESFETAGFDIVPFNSEADVYVINSCSVTGQAESKSRYAVRSAKRSAPGAKVVVTGCAAQMEINTSPGDIHELADAVVPNPDKLNTLSHVLPWFPGLESRPNSVDKSWSGRTRATLKVQDGCNVCCSYCSIPWTRPGLVSRPWREVLDEAKKLADMGYLEAVLTGVLIGEYGPESGSGGPDFCGLVELLAKESGLPRLRISSIECQQVTDGLIGLAADGRIVPHFHIPLQAGDDGVLRDMNRRYSQADFVALCDKIRRNVPGVTLTTDVLVGFPTETHDRFLSSVTVFEQVRFLKAHVFRFSLRPGTVAEKWGDPVHPKEKQERAARLTDLSNQTGAEVVRRSIGQTHRVLVEGKVPRDGVLEGLTDNWMSVQFTGPKNLARTIQWVEIQDSKGSLAFGELATRTRPGARLTVV